MPNQNKETQSENKSEVHTHNYFEMGLKAMENADNSNYNEAIEFFKKAINNEQPSIAAYNNMGLAYCNLHKFSDAIKYFDDAIKIDPHYVNAHNNKGLAYYYQGRSKTFVEQKEDYYKALECFNTAIEVNAKDTNAWSNKGNILFKLGWHDEAINCINEAIKIDPNNANAWNNKGHAFSSLERHQEAINYFDRALDINAQHAEAWNNKGNALSRLSRYSDDVNEENLEFDQALECYNKSLQFSNLADALNNKALLLLNNGENKAALRLIKEWAKKNVANENTKDIEGLAYFNLGKYDAASNCFDTVIMKNNNSKTAWYHKGNVKLKQKDPKAAIKCYNQALGIDAMFAEAHNAKSIAYYTRGEYAKAIVEASRAIEIKPSLVAAEENFAKLSIPMNETSNQNFWDFWGASVPKKIVGVLLGMALALIVSFSIFMPPFLRSTSMLTQPAILIPIIGIILLILLVPEIKKAKMGPMELELKEQHIHPTTNTPSLSENVDRKDYFA